MAALWSYSEFDFPVPFLSKGNLHVMPFQRELMDDSNRNSISNAVFAFNPHHMADPYPGRRSLWPIVRIAIKEACSIGRFVPF
jgi:hypothetical protein